MGQRGQVTRRPAQRAKEMTMKKKKPVLFANRLDHDQLLDVVERIQAILWLEQDERDETWDPDKEWDSETIEQVAAVMTEYGLRPEHPEHT
jgi:hypothetical protein